MFTQLFFSNSMLYGFISMYMHFTRVKFLTFLKASIFIFLVLSYEAGRFQIFWLPQLTQHAFPEKVWAR